MATPLTLTPRPYFSRNPMSQFSEGIRALVSPNCIKRIRFSYLLPIVQKRMELLDLPDEILAHILSFAVDEENIARLALVSKRFLASIGACLTSKTFTATTSFERITRFFGLVNSLREVHLFHVNEGDRIVDRLAETNRELEVLDLRKVKQFTNSSFACIAKSFAQLRTLRLINVKLSDSALGSIGALKLKELSLLYSQYSFNALTSLFSQNLQLETFECSLTTLSRQEGRALGSCRQLRNLTIIAQDEERAAINEGVKALVRKCKKLERFNSVNSDIDDMAVIEMIRRIPTLRVLSFASCSLVSKMAIDLALRLLSLQELYLVEDEQISPYQTSLWRQAYPNVRIVG